MQCHARALSFDNIDVDANANNRKSYFSCCDGVDDDDAFDKTAIIRECAECKNRTSNKPCLHPIFLSRIFYCYYY